MTTVSVKGNNGRAARKLFVRRLTTILLVFAVTGFGLFLLGVGQGKHGNSVNPPPPREIRQIRTAERKMKVETRKKPKVVAEEEDPSEEEDLMIELSLENPEENKPLLSGKYHLIDLEVDYDELDEAEDDSYAGITAEFCMLDFSLHKKDPSSVPMFRFLVEASPGCKDGVHYKADLKTFATLARLHDSMSNFVSVLDLSGVVFHESRCGSTLVANALAAMNPAQNRVYSESAPPLAALKTICGETYSHCSLEQAAQILADTVYLMSRTTDPVESRVFFKIQSIGTRNIEVFQHAFPSTPWIFVYRDPVQVMMSQLAMGPRSANCVRPRKFKSDVAADLAHEKGKRIVDLSDEEYCALHLATITEAAVAAMQREPRLGTPVNYANLPDILYNDIIPNKFGVELSQEEIDNIIRVSSVYSKGTGNRKGEFKDDSKRKEKLATAEVRAASHLFLDESYATLEGGGLAGATAR